MADSDRTELLAQIDTGLRSSTRGRWLGIVVFGAAACLLPLFVTSSYGLGIVNEMLVYAVVGVGFYLMLGLSGQFAFSQAAVFGLGAYCSSWACRSTGFWVSVLFAVAVVAVITALLAVILRRSSDLYFAIATLGFSEIVIVVISQWTAFAGPGGDTPVPKTPSLFGAAIDTPVRYFWLFLIALVVALALVTLIDLSPLRRETIAVRDRPSVASGLGISVVANRTVMFVLGSSFAAVAGAIFAHSQGFISPDSFGTDLGIDLFVIVILGGMFSAWGPLLGAAFVVGVPELSRGFSQYRDLIFSLILVAVILLVPQGFAGLIDQCRQYVVGAVRKGRARA